MDFKSWFQKKMKQQLPSSSSSSSSKEEEITKTRSKIDSVENESKEVDIQSIEQQLSSSSLSASKQTTSSSKSIISYDDNEKKIFTKTTFLMFYAICQNSG